MKAKECKRKQKTKRGYATRYKGIHRLSGGGFRIRARGTCPKTRREREKQDTMQVGSIHDALRRQRELQEEIEDEPMQADQTITVGEYAKLWIKQQTARLGRDDGHRHSTVRDRADVLEQHILPEIGSICMDRLARSDLVRWQRTMQLKKKKDKKLYSNVTINNWWRMLRAMVRAAVLELDLPSDPTFGVKALKEGRGKRKLKLTDGQLVDFLTLIYDRYPQHFAMVVTLAATGFRFGEVSALEWGDLDERESIIHVRRSQVRQNVALPKSGHERETVVPAFVFDVLRWHRLRMIREQSPGVETQLVFPSDVGRYRYPSTLVKPFRWAAKQMKITESIGAHHLRHAFNHLLRKGGVDRMVLRKMVGHTSEAMTQRYSDAERGEIKAASEKHIAPILSLVAKRIDLPLGKTGVETGVGDKRSEDAALDKLKADDVSTLTSKKKRAK